ncbi:hypothetical protein HPB48_017651 [Haemaphysalis longicornis]|uniref:Cytochrome P450 n=1 Tax=Haemaphysalis longicornis TaxID=44386 RepID=A0A9J6GX50_HAELO|nr:hypothetical protein HPB48_017651 [Haemaphysalis longicornis]
MSWANTHDGRAVAGGVWTPYQFTLFFVPLLTVVAGLIRCWLWRARVPPGTRVPPMPPASSIRGHAEVLAFGFHRKKAMEWAKQLGPVIRLKWNFADIVVLNDFKSVKQFMNTKQILDRSHCFLLKREYYSGVGSVNGETWVANRKFCLGMLRDLGFAKTAMEDNMMDEFSHLEKRIGNTKGAPINVQEYIQPCALNNIASFVYGKRLPIDHPERHQLQRLVAKLYWPLLKGPIQLFLPPIVRRILEHLPFTRLGQVNACMKELEKFNDSTKQENAPNASSVSTLLSPTDSPRKRHHGMVRTPHVYWNLLVNANNPDTIQARVQKEIDDVVGSERSPTWEDRKRMPFTLACIWEVDRWKTGSPLGVARECSEDVVIGEFFIPKGTTVLPNLWAVHNDPTFWKDPEKFDPARFLNEDGSIVSPKPEQLLPFSIGRRSCPGEMFALMEVFLMTTFLLQKYASVPDRDVKIN